MRDRGTFIAVAWGAFAATFIFWFYSGMLHEQVAWCISGEEHCVREWAGALSGWAAALAAGITIFYLIEQVSEAKRQTDFTIGISPPTCYLYDPREIDIGNAHANRLDIVNWSRDPILIRKITLLGASPTLVLETEVVDHDVARKRQLIDELRRERMFIPGWIDRSKGPTRAEIDLLVSDRPPNALVLHEGDMVRRPLTFVVHYVSTGAKPEDLTIEVERPDALVAEEIVLPGNELPLH